MITARSGAFLSYARTDDRSSHGFISDLREEISQEMRSRTGVPFPIFQDRLNIRWGEQWDDRILNALQTSLFFLPILTPSFIRSDACQREILRFRQFERELGREDLILPLYFIDVPEIDRPARPSDEVVPILQARQFIDLRQHRGKKVEALLSDVIIDIGAEILQRLSALGSQPGRQASNPIEHTAPLDDSSFRVVSAAPAFPPLEFRDRREVFPILVDRIGKASTRLSVVTGSPGAGKTAVVSQLQSMIEAGDVLQDTSAFVYLDARGARPASVATVIEDLIECLHEQSDRDRVGRQIRDAAGSWYDAISVLFNELANRRVLYVIDGAEALLGPDGTVRDRSFRNLLDLITTRRNHAVHTILISSIRLNDRFEGYQPADAIDLQEGLPLAEIGPLVQAWSTPASAWHSGATAIDLEDLYELTAGSPRLVELLLNASLAWPDLSPAEQVARLKDIRRSHMAGVLANAAMSVLEDDVLSTIIVLAAFGRPVPDRALSHLLNSDVGASLSSLVETRFVRRDGDNYYLPPGDATHILKEAPNRQAFSKLEVMRGGAMNLIRRAADWLHDETIGRGVERVEDLSYHLRDIELRLAIGEYHVAFQKLSDVDEEYLEGWGHSDVISDMRLAVEGRLGHPNDELRNLAQYANAKSRQEQHSTALAAVERGAIHLQALGPGERPRAVQLQTLMRARIFYDDGRLAEAEAMYRAAVDDRLPVLSRAEFTQALIGAALCRAEVGDFEGALGGLIEAENYLGSTGEAPHLRAQLNYNQGLVYMYLGEYKSAVGLLGRASTRACAAGDHLLDTMAVDALALLRYCEGKSEGAAKLARRASQMAVRFGSPKISRNAYGTLALVELNRGNGDAALAAAEAAAQYAGSRKGWGAQAILGIARLRELDVAGARGAFFEALEYARLTLRKEPQNFQALEFEGLVLTGLTVAGSDDYREEARAAYAEARRLTQAPGVVKLCLLKLEDMLAEEHQGGYDAVVAAAQGIVVDAPANQSNEQLS
ncbi:NACHT domain-containing protein [Friedmanniella luteola]|uniref:NACHT domain-containing protein n=1 Tax=Friedmanniella luteola TaxID=546871 RepID=A0A1H1M5Y7_9ACTN|nr:toll/interleukin-1 receptor domain-containing protein [Friedmanniella luteola]SDR82198.1 NACHT domain-containing protein [Friedmanniella luteola]